MAFTNFSKPLQKRIGAVAKQKPVLMRLNRNYTLRSTLGHMLTFKKDVPMPIPPIMIRACAEIGAERVDGKDAFEVKEVVKVVQPVDPGSRLDDVRAGLDKIAERNDSREFTAAGMPKVAVVSEVVGYKVDRTEVTKAWQDRAEELAENNDTE
jgi:hypothetical protein